MSLTDEQQRFIEEYLVDLNATQAALRVGCSSEKASAVGYEYLKNWRITDKISEAIQSRVKRVAVSQDYVIEKIVDTIERGLSSQEFEELTNGPLARGKGRKFDAAGILKACELLGKHLGMFQNKVADEHNDGLGEKRKRAENETDEELAARIKETFKGLLSNSD